MDAKRYAVYGAMRTYQREKEEQDDDKKRVPRIPPHKVIRAAEAAITIAEPRPKIDVRA